MIEVKSIEARCGLEETYSEAEKMGLRDSQYKT